MGVTRETVNNESVWAVMRAKGISQSQLARDFQFNSPGAVGNKLAGRVEWSASEIATLAKMCGVSMETFFRPVTIDIRPSAIVDSDIPGYHDQGLSPGVMTLKRVA